MVGAITRGELTTSVAGVAITQERSEVVDFTLSVVSAQSAIFVRRPSRSDISGKAYGSEFRVRFLLRYKT